MVFDMEIIRTTRRVVVLTHELIGIAVANTECAVTGQNLLLSRPVPEISQ